jgi:hypothetical protein
MAAESMSYVGSKVLLGCTPHPKRFPKTTRKTEDHWSLSFRLAILAILFACMEREIE